MKRTLVPLAIVVLGSSSGCINSDPDDNDNNNDIGSEQTLILEHYFAPCYGPFERLCPQQIDPETGEVSHFYDDIEGFEQAWGHRYELRVLVTDVPPPIPADGSSLRYALLEVVSDVVINEPFSLTLSQGFVSPTQTPGRLRLGGSRDIECEVGLHCEAIAGIIGEDETVEVEFIHSLTEDGPILARSLSRGWSYERTMTLDHYFDPCKGLVARYCAREITDGTSVELLYESIEGFEQSWGHRYELRVRVHIEPGIFYDSSALRYELVEIIADEVSTDAFTLTLSAVFIEGDPDTQKFGLIEGSQVVCVEASVCEIIASAMATGESVAVTFEHGADSDQLLTAVNASPLAVTTAN